MKQYFFWIILFISFQTQSCFIIDTSIKRNQDKVDVEGLIGEFHSTFKRSYRSTDPTDMSIKINNDNCCYITTYPNGTCPNIGFDGKWKIKGRYLHIENFPIKEPILIESKKTNGDSITIQIIGEAPNCLVYSNGIYSDYFDFDESGIFNIPGNNIDSIQISDNIIFKYLIYNRDLKNNYFKIQFFKIYSTYEFYYKLRIINEDTLIGTINNFDYCFIKNKSS